MLHTASSSIMGSALESLVGLLGFIQKSLAGVEQSIIVESINTNGSSSRARRDTVLFLHHIS